MDTDAYPILRWKRKEKYDMIYVIENWNIKAIQNKGKDNNT